MAVLVSSALETVAIETASCSASGNNSNVCQSKQCTLIIEKQDNYKFFTVQILMNHLLLRRNETAHLNSFVFSLYILLFFQPWWTFTFCRMTLMWLCCLADFCCLCLLLLHILLSFTFKRKQQGALQSQRKLIFRSLLNIWIAEPASIIFCCYLCRCYPF